MASKDDLKMLRREYSDVCAKRKVHKQNIATLQQEVDYLTLRKDLLQKNIFGLERELAQGIEPQANAPLKPLSVGCAPVLKGPPPPPTIPEPYMSDHAILRYLERHLELDIANLREKVFTDFLKDACKLGSAKVSTSEGTFVIHNHKVVTFYP